MRRDLIAIEEDIQRASLQRDLDELRVIMQDTSLSHPRKSLALARALERLGRDLNRHRPGEVPNLVQDTSLSQIGKSTALAQALAQADRNQLIKLYYALLQAPDERNQLRGRVTCVVVGA